MSETYKTLYSGQPGTSAATVYTAPSAAIIKNMVMVNVAAVPVTIKLFQGGTTDAKCIQPAITLGPGEWAEWDGSKTMATGDTIAAQASAATSITLTIDGIEVA